MTKVKVLRDFTMGEKRFLAGSDVQFEGWRAERLVGEGLVIIIKTETAEELPPVVQAVEDKPSPKKSIKRSKR